jgi:hypothetical protein
MCRCQEANSTLGVYNLPLYQIYRAHNQNSNGRTEAYLCLFALIEAEVSKLGLPTKKVIITQWRICGVKLCTRACLYHQYPIHSLW